MKIYLLLFCVIVFSSFTTAQTQKTYYFNEKWEKVASKAEATYYRIVDFDAAGNPGKAVSYYMNGTKQFEGRLTSIEPEIADGQCIWYDQNGNIINTDFWQNGESNSAKVEELWKEAYALAEKEDYKNAIPVFRKVIEQEKVNPMARVIVIGVASRMLGLGYFKLEDYEKAIENYLIAIPVFEQQQQYQELDDIYWNIAMSYRFTGQHEKRMEYFKKALDNIEKSGSKQDLMEIYTQLGIGCMDQSRYADALNWIEKSYNEAKKTGDKDLMCGNLSNIAMMYYRTAQLDKAEEKFQKALQMALDVGNKTKASTIYTNLGTIYKDQGKYQQALECFQKAADMEKELQLYGEYALDLSYIGHVYLAWADFKKGLEYMQKAIDISDSHGHGQNKHLFYNDMCLLYYAKNDYAKAKEFGQKAIAGAEKYGIKNIQAQYYINLAEIFETEENFSKSIELNLNAVQIATETTDEKYLAKAADNLGRLYVRLEKPSQALRYYETAYKMNKKNTLEPEMAENLYGLGLVSFAVHKFTESIDYFEEAVKVIEKLRLTATGETRRNFLDQQILYYQALTAACVKSNQPAKAFNSTEIASAKFLLEQMGQTNRKGTVNTIDIQQFQKGISDKTAVVRFSNINMTIASVRLVATKNILKGYEVSDKTLLEKVQPLYGQKIAQTYQSLRGFKNITHKENPLQQTSEKGKTDFEKLINYYRELLKDEKKGNLNNPDFVKISKMLYQFLFASIEGDIAGKEHLLIIPDGILAFVPFETLIMPDGRFLCEKYSISYTPSLTVLNSVSNRNYSQSRKEMLAFGGAVYDEGTYNAKMGVDADDVLFAVKGAGMAMKEGKDMNPYYQKMGYQWNNLPGTLDEVKELANQVKDVDVYTGNQASETSIKSLSKGGKLANYKTLHFAVHGIVVPEMPEMSAIVLSQNDKNEDGYLQMNEIADLNINADLVNLSACQTGLGKIYGGEGVVGLTQSFLIAGAKNLSVSLWSVNDASTKTLMTEFYKLTGKASYSSALNQVKQKFIKGEYGEKYKAPFYWAPFVYYGN